MTTLPTENQCDWTATPSSPLAGSRATIEYVPRRMALILAATAALRRAPRAARGSRATACGCGRAGVEGVEQRQAADVAAAISTRCSKSGCSARSGNSRRASSSVSRSSSPLHLDQVLAQFVVRAGVGPEVERGLVERARVVRPQQVETGRASRSRPVRQAAGGLAQLPEPRRARRFDRRGHQRPAGLEVVQVRAAGDARARRRGVWWCSRSRPRPGRRSWRRAALRGWRRCARPGCGGRDVSVRAWLPQNLRSRTNVLARLESSPFEPEDEMAATDALVFDAIRTPRGKGKVNGSLHATKPVDLVVGPDARDARRATGSSIPTGSTTSSSAASRRSATRAPTSPRPRRSRRACRTPWRASSSTASALPASRRSTSPPRRSPPAGRTSSSPAASSRCRACRWAPTAAPGRWTPRPTTTPTSSRRASART